MNILVFSWRDPKHPFAGGAEQVMHEHMKGWVDAGNLVVLFTSCFPGAAKDEMLDGVQIIRRGNQILTVHILALFWYLFAKHEKFDLVVDEFHGIPFFSPLFVKAKKLAVLQEVAGSVWLKNDLPIPLNWIVGRIGYYLEPLVFLLYRKTPFMVGSQSAKDALVKIGISAQNITIVNHGVIINKPKKSIKKESGKTIIFLGALAKDKGIEDAIETFAILNNKGNYNFWVVGRSGESYRRYLKNKVGKLGIKDKTIFWGFVSQNEKFKLLARAHLLINPSILEGWGLVNIEANAMGTPVIAYNSPGLVDSVKNGVSGLICNNNSPECLADSIGKVLNDEILYENLQKGAVSWSRKFSWNKSREKGLTLTNSLV